MDNERSLRTVQQCSGIEPSLAAFRSNSTFPTQRRIASILSAYDDLIENNTRRIKLLEQMAQAIYREWFVEFRAPGVKLRKATSEEQKVTGKDRFPAGWELDGWTMRWFGKVASIFRKVTTGRQCASVRSHRNCRHTCEVKVKGPGVVTGAVVRWEPSCISKKTFGR